MKLIVLLIISVMFCIEVGAQTPPTEPTMTDFVERPNCEDLLARLDSHTHSVMYSPTPATGQIVLLPGQNSIHNLRLEKYIRRYIVSRKFQDKIDFYISSRSNDHVGVEFWVSSSGKKPNLAVAKLDHTLQNQNFPVFFDSELFEAFREKSGTTFVGLNCGACCISSLDWFLLSDLLNTNPKLTVYVVIRGKPNKHKSLKNHLNRDMKGSGVRPSRVKYLFSDKNRASSSQFSEVDVFLSDRLIRSATVLPSDFEPVKK